MTRTKLSSDIHRRRTIQVVLELLVVKLMALAFRSAQLPLPHRKTQNRIPSICSAEAPEAPEAPRATKLSLPTYRERRYLEDNYVERAKGRAAHYARTTAFTLMAWPLVVRELAPEEIERRRRWLKKQRAEQDGVQSTPNENAPVLSEEIGDVISDAGTEEIVIPEVGYEMVLGMNHDSLLLDASEYEEESLLLEASKWDFTIPPWAYVVRVRAGKTGLGKRAVQRNRAKRRIRAAASVICPNHASRGREYVFTANPEALTIGYHDLVDEVRISLKRASCWEDELAIEMLRREKYCKR